jgi:hypothetical protein
MLVDIFTKEDLEEFRRSLIKDIIEIVDTKIQPTDKWLKSYEVRKLLNISQGTLQSLRDNKKIEYTKIGNIFLYNNKDIIKMLENNRIR